jgi:AcrR family transcriptional regulator
LRRSDEASPTARRFSTRLALVRIEVLGDRLPVSLFGAWGMTIVRGAEIAAKRNPAPSTGATKQAARDADKTRARILAAAETEFAQKGLAGARVDAIAEASGANKRMMYYYFNSKEELYIAVLERAYTQMRSSERDLALDHLDPIQAIRRLVEFKFDYCIAHPMLIKLLNGENMLDAAYLKQSKRLRQMHVSLVKTLRSILDAGMRKGVIRPGIDPLHLYISISGLSYFYFSNTPTLSAAFGHHLATPAERKARRRHVIDVIVAYLRP